MYLVFFFIYIFLSNIEWYIIIMLILQTVNGHFLPPSFKNNILMQSWWQIRFIIAILYICITNSILNYTSLSKTFINKFNNMMRENKFFKKSYFMYFVFSISVLQCSVLILQINLFKLFLKKWRAKKKVNKCTFWCPWKHVRITN